MAVRQGAMEGMAMSNGIAGVLCCYNSHQHLLPTLDSIFNQTRPLDELVVVDDCSTDDTTQIVQDYLVRLGTAAPRTTVLRNPSNLGIAMSFNVGLKNCTERYALLFSHDDINHPQRVESSLHCLETTQGAIACSYMGVVDSAEVSVVSDSATTVALQMALSNVIPAPTVAFDLQVARTENLFFNPQYDFAEDYDLWCKYILRGYDFQVIPECLVHYRRHAGQVSNTKLALQQKVAESIRIQYLNALMPFFPASQSDVFLKVLLRQPDMINRLDKGFIDNFLQSANAAQVPANIRRVFDFLIATVQQSA